MSPTNQKWFRRVFVALMMVGVVIAIWQRLQIGRAEKPMAVAARKEQNQPRLRNEKTDVRSATDTLNDLQEIAARPRLSRADWDQIFLQTMRLLRKLPTKDLIVLMESTDPNPTPTEENIQLCCMLEFSVRRPFEALDLALQLDLDAASSDVNRHPILLLPILPRLTIKDPDGVQNWLKNSRDNVVWPPNFIVAVDESINEAIMCEKIHRDPLGTFAEIISHNHPEAAASSAEFNNSAFINCLEPRHWSAMAAIAEEDIQGEQAVDPFGKRGGGKFQSLAIAMVHQLGFEEAQESADDLNLSNKGESLLIENLIRADIGPATPNRATNWLNDHPLADQANAAAALTQEWVRSDPIAAAAWFASVVEAQHHGYFDSLVRQEIVNRPRQAAQMALEHPDEIRRTRLLKEVLKKWQSSDPLGAQTFIQELDATKASDPSAQ